ncbi:diaminopimelate epimerase [Hydrogenophaga defluvii]|uniref:Diaminopimelate epimerase n=1 Tax=Hydrogenophaga defluvii TaxID=249410 RepID=A0ABW2SHV4_9BURK
MLIRFTKMQGAGNDFVVLDETQGRLGLSAAQYRFLADRHFGVGADQILTVRPAPMAGVDFEYVIHNADGGEVEHCGNGARCFVRFVRERGLTAKDVVRVKVHGGVIELRLNADGRVTVDMGAPVFDLPRVPFDAGQAYTESAPEDAFGGNAWPLWTLPLPGHAAVPVAVLSMGNPHAVLRVDDVDQAPVLGLGPLIEAHPAFPRRVNAGFLQVLDRGHVKLRVFERGVGETLACGTGACAAVVAGIRQGWLDERVDVATRGGQLTIEWAGGAGQLGAPVLMTGPATTVFQGEIDVPEL